MVLLLWYLLLLRFLALYFMWFMLLVGIRVLPLLMLDKFK